MKRRYKILGLLLAALMLLTAVSCADRGDEPGNASTEAPSATPDTTDAGADESKTEPIPEVPDTGDAMKITANELLTLIREGNIAENGDYALTGTEYLTFDSTDNRKTYDLKGATIRIATRDGDTAVTLKSVRNLTLTNCNLAVTGDTAIRTSGSRECLLSGIHVSGSGKVGFAAEGKVNTLDGCTVSGAYATAVLASGESIGVTNCTLQGAAVGIRDASGNGCVAENNVLRDCTVGIETAVPNTVIWYNTVTGGECGVRAVFEKSEISAGLSDGYNILAAKNRISGAATSILFENVSNGVILHNEAETVTATGCTYLYANENSLTNLTLKNNDYLIANGNTAAQLTASGNTNQNGDNVTDLSVRPSAGANEALQPHINSDQFVGMKRKATVRSLGDGQSLDKWLKAQIENGKTVIVPPGAYIGSVLELENIQNATVYAYGVLDEVTSFGNCTVFNACENITLKGIFFTFASYPFFQGTVLNSNNGTFEILLDPGYRDDLSAAWAGNYFRPNEKTGICDFPSIGGVTYNSDTGTYTVRGAMHAEKPGMVEVGYRVGFRGYATGNAMSMSGCSGFLIEDVTVFTSGGFAASDYGSDVAPVYHRYAVTYGPAPVLESGKDYSRYNQYSEIVTTDAYGRLRSAEPIYTTCDATHSTDSRTGMQAISCLLEGMNDDGGNINAHYGLASDFDAASKTLTYTTCDVRGYHLLPGEFRVGDEIMLFDWNGKLVAQTTVTEATASVGNDQYTVRLKDSISLPSDIRVVVQNLSVSGKGFLWDNVTVRTSQANGLRVKAPGGKVVNCFFDNVRACGVSVVPEWSEWPEVGFAQDLEILNCIFDGNSRTAAMWEHWNQNAMGASIQIGGGTSTGDADYCLHRNIRISGNVFRNRFSRYQIVITAVKDLSLTDNRFEAPQASASLSENGAPILILGGNGVTISGNSFSSEVIYPVENRGSLVEGLTGDDLAG